MATDPNQEGVPPTTENCPEISSTDSNAPPSYHDGFDIANCFPSISAQLQGLFCTTNLDYIYKLPSILADKSRLRIITKIATNSMVNCGLIQSTAAPSVDCSKLNNGDCDLCSYTFGGLFTQLYGLSGYQCERKNIFASLESSEYFESLTQQDRPTDDVSKLTADDIKQNGGMSEDMDRSYYERYLIDTTYNRYAYNSRVTIPGQWGGIVGNELSYYLKLHSGETSELENRFDQVLDLLNKGTFDAINVSDDRYQFSNQLMVNAAHLIHEKLLLSFVISFLFIFYYYSFFVLLLFFVSLLFVL